MASFSKLQKFSILGIGIVVSTAIIYNFENPINYIQDLKSGKFNFPISKWDYNWDRRDSKSLLKPTKNATELHKPAKNKIKSIRHIILVRHGQYNLQGKTDDERYLTKLGRLQAEATGMRLAELGVPYTTIIRSTMTRAQETSKYIQMHLPDVPVVDDCLLVEGFPISPDPPSGHWKPEKLFFQDGPRIEAAFRKYMYRAESPNKSDTYDVIVCHGNVIRYFVCRALQFPPEAWLRMSLNHGSITWISILPSGRVILRCFGETGHMMPEWISST